nr:translation initiation factor IF-2-like [Anser cygnoides]
MPNGDRHSHTRTPPLAPPRPRPGSAGRRGTGRAGRGLGREGGESGLSGLDRRESISGHFPACFPGSAPTLRAADAGSAAGATTPLSCSFAHFPPPESGLRRRSGAEAGGRTGGGAPRTAPRARRPRGLTPSAAGASPWAPAGPGGGGAHTDGRGGGGLPPGRAAAAPGSPLPAPEPPPRPGSPMAGPGVCRGARADRPGKGAGLDAPDVMKLSPKERSGGKKPLSLNCLLQDVGKSRARGALGRESAPPRKASISKVKKSLFSGNSFPFT